MAGVFPAKTFVAHARPRGQKIVIELVKDLAKAGQPLPAFAYSLTNSPPANTVGVLGALPSAVTVRMLVPEIDLLPREKELKQPVYAWTNSVPSITATASQAAPWLRSVIESEADGGATVLITPSPLVEAGHGEVELRRVLEWADTSRSLKVAQGMPVLTGLTLHRDWLSNNGKRETLLNVLTDVPDPGFYILVRWPPAKSGTNIGELAILQGYRELVEVLADDAREVVAARNGLAGWALAALGASAWTAALPASHVYRDAMVIRRQKGSSPPAKINHYLDRQLLSFVPEARLPAVSAVSGPPKCSCADCTILVGGYDDRAASRHLLRLHTSLARALAGAKSPRALAHNQVRTAIATIGGNAFGLAAAQTGHLQSWDQLLT